MKINWPDMTLPPINLWNLQMTSNSKKKEKPIEHDDLWPDTPTPKQPRKKK